MIPRFRAWYTPFKGKTIGQEMKYGQAGRLITHAEMAPDKYVLMQSTGMKDKNGVEIFEGDLVEHDDNLNGDWETFEACEVVYDKDYAQFCFKWDAGNFLTDYRNLNVIGNIYENPELLKEEQR
ncbi:YopX family protein [Enterococcus hirae]